MFYDSCSVTVLPDPARTQRGKARAFHLRGLRVIVPGRNSLIWTFKRQPFVLIAHSGRVSDARHANTSIRASREGAACHLMCLSGQRCSAHKYQPSASTRDVYRSQLCTMSRRLQSEVDSGGLDEFDAPSFTDPQLREPKPSMVSSKRRFQYIHANWLFILSIILHILVVMFNVALIIFNFKRRQVIVHSSAAADVTFLLASWSTGAILKVRGSLQFFGRHRSPDCRGTWSYFSTLRKSWRGHASINQS